MRLCILLPRVLPSVPYSPITQVVSHFNTHYRSALATIATACARGHEVQCVLVGPDPPSSQSFASLGLDQAQSGANTVDPSILRLLDAFGKHGQFKVALATSPNFHDPESPFQQEAFVELRSDLFGATHWVTTINSLVAPGSHCVIDGIGAECAGALKYALSDSKYNQGVNDKGVPVSWNNRDFPTAEGLVKALCQVYASHKMVGSLSSAQSRMKRAPESSVIDPSVRDAARVHLPRELQFASAEDAKRDNIKQSMAIDAANESDFESSGTKSFPDDLLILSMSSWRNLDIAEWFRKRVLSLPQYDGGDQSEMCIAAVEDSYAYFQDMFRQKTFEDYSFICVPPFVEKPFVEQSNAGDEVRDFYLNRAVTVSPDDILELTRDNVLPVDVFRGLGLFDERYLARALGLQLANSDRAGYTFPMNADMIGETVVTEIEQYLESDAQERNSLFQFRGEVEAKRKKSKETGGLKLASHGRLTCSYPLSEEDFKVYPDTPRYVNPIFMYKKTRELEKKYTEMKWMKMDMTEEVEKDEE